MAFLLAATLVWTVPPNSSTYNPWAVLFALCAQHSALRLLRSPHAAHWAADLGAGLAFATKQNIGLLCFAALVLGLFFSRRRLLPLAAVGFLVAAAISYWSNLYFTPLALWQAYGYPAGTLSWCRSLLYIAPIFLLVPLLAARQRPVLRTQLICAIAALGFAYPRWDHVHMALCAPFVALSLASVRRLSIPAAGSFGAILLLQFIVWGILIATPLPATLSAVKPFQGLRVSPEFAALVESANTQLPPRQRDDRGIFVLHPAAATLYLASGVPNPTPYDYPLNSAFGPQSQQQVIQQIRTGLIPAVCLPDPLWTTDPLWSLFAPLELINYVRTEMEPGPDLSNCRIYRPR